MEKGPLVALQTYPPHYLLQWGGTLFSSEIWSNSLRLVQNAGSIISPTALQTFLTEFEGELRTFQASGIFSLATNATYAKINPIGPNGRYLSDTQSNSRFFTTAARGTGASCTPPQIAVAASLVTASERGLASKGRIYLAGMSATSFATDATDGTITAANATTIRDAVTTFLNNINNNPGLDAEFGGLDVHVVSEGNAFTNGIARKVTGVRVGRVWDTQRRRRNNLPEGYTAPSVVT